MSENLHIPPAKLEVDSEDEDEEVNEKLLSASKIKNWSDQYYKNKKFISFFKKLTQALQNAVGLSKDQKNKILDGSTFNAIVQACLLDVEPGLCVYFNVPEGATHEYWITNVIRTVKYKKRRSLFYTYFCSLMKLSMQMTSKNSLLAILNHIKIMLPLMLNYAKLIRLILKFFIKLWSADDDESVRILAFLNIITSLKILDTLKQQQNTENRNTNKIVKVLSSLDPFDLTLKKMYKAYISNSHFTNPANIPMIRFMQKTMIEVLNLNLDITYKFAFVNIRQLAIQLRNALNTKHKDNIQLVYNWQYLHALELWCQFVTQHSFATSSSVDWPSYSGEDGLPDEGDTSNRAADYGVILSKCPYHKLISTLVSPLVQIIMGTIKLVPSSRFVPLRFNLIRCLTYFGQANIYVPVLPFILEVFDLIDFNQKSGNASNKFYNVDLLLKVSKLEVKEKTFKDEIINRIYDLTLDYLINYAHYASFPEITYVARQQLKKFINRCKIPPYKSSLKQLHNKIQENAEYLEKNRSNLKINLIKDLDQLDEFEKSVRTETPLFKFYNSWKKLRTEELINDISQRDKISEYDNIPSRVNLLSNIEGSSDDNDSDNASSNDEDDQIDNHHKKNVKRKLHGAVADRKSKKGNRSRTERVKQPFKFPKGSVFAADNDNEENLFSLKE